MCRIPYLIPMNLIPMKKLLFLLSVTSLLYLPATAQRKIEKSYKLPASGKINLDFQEVSVVKVKTWDKNEIGIQATVSINNGENDEAFELKVQEGTDAISLETILNNEENIPRKNFITTKDGTRYFVKTADWNSKEVQEFIATHGDEGVSFVGSGILKDIFIDVFIPGNADLSVYSKNGDIEVENFSGPLVANSKNGVVDISVPQDYKATFELRTRHGEIYTNLPLEQKKTVGTEVDNRRDKWNVVYGKLNGGGPVMNLESKNGSIYLRKIPE